MRNYIHMITYVPAKQNFYELPLAQPRLSVPWLQGIPSLAGRRYSKETHRNPVGSCWPHTVYCLFEVPIPWSPNRHLGCLKMIGIGWKEEGFQPAGLLEVWPSDCDIPTTRNLALDWTSQYPEVKAGWNSIVLNEKRPLSIHPKSFLESKRSNGCPSSLQADGRGHDEHFWTLLKPHVQNQVAIESHLRKNYIPEIITITMTTITIILKYLMCII